MIEHFIAYDCSHYNIELVAKLPTGGRIGVCLRQCLKLGVR